MNTLYDKQMETIERYLLNQLSESESNDFEASFMDNPELFAEVQRQEAFQTALKHEKAALSARSPANRRLRLFEWITQPYSVASTAAFATLAIAYIGGSSFIGNPGGQPGISLVASSLTLETMRGQEEHIVADGRGPILLTIDAGPGSLSKPTNYVVSLIDNDSMEVEFTSEPAQADSEGWLRVIINQNLEGDFELRVSDTEQQVNSFGVRFTN